MESYYIVYKYIMHAHSYYCVILHWTQNNISYIIEVAWCDDKGKRVDHEQDCGFSPLIRKLARLNKITFSYYQKHKNWW